MALNGEQVTHEMEKKIKKMVESHSQVLELEKTNGMIEGENKILKDEVKLSQQLNLITVPQFKDKSSSTSPEFFHKNRTRFTSIQPPSQRKRPHTRKTVAGRPSCFL